MRLYSKWYSMKKSAVLFLAFISILSLCVAYTRFGRAAGAIYIRADGTVDPSTAPIQRVGNVYTFTGNVADDIIIEKDSIVLDGTGRTLQAEVSLDGRTNVTLTHMVIRSSGSGIMLNQASNCRMVGNDIVADRSGIRLRNSNYNTISDSSIEANIEYGLALAFSSNNIISNNNITTGIIDGINVGFSSNNVISGNNLTNKKSEYPIGFGIQFDGSSNCSITANKIMGFPMAGINIQSDSNNNRIEANHVTYGGSGIRISGSQNNNIAGNYVADNAGVGIHFDAASNNILRNNIMSNNTGNLKVESYTSSASGWINDVDTSNTADGKPVLYWINEVDRTVPLNAGYIGLVNCTRITVEGFTFMNKGQGVLLAYTTNSTVTRNNAINDCTIYLSSSSGNRIAENNIAGNGNGIYAQQSSGNTISANSITNNNKGIYLSGCSNNTITGNNVANNTNGIWFGGSSNNKIYLNNFQNNGHQAYDIAMEGLTASASLTVANFASTHVRQLISMYEEYVNFLGPPSVNTWDNGSRGNYWGDYIGTDANGDGVGDSPYIIYGDNKDNYPLVAPVKVVVPEFPSLLVLSTFMIALLVAASAYKRKHHASSNGQSNKGMAIAPSHIGILRASIGCKNFNFETLKRQVR
jgi:parallel beta-helix repeat protein